MCHGKLLDSTANWTFLIITSKSVGTILLLGKTQYYVQLFLHHFAQKWQMEEEATTQILNWLYSSRTYSGLKNCKIMQYQMFVLDVLCFYNFSLLFYSTPQKDALQSPIHKNISNLLYYICGIFYYISKLGAGCLGTI